VASGLKVDATMTVTSVVGVSVVVVVTEMTGENVDTTTLDELASASLVVASDAVAIIPDAITVVVGG